MKSRHIISHLSFPTLIIISALFSLRMRTLDPNQINKPPDSRFLSELELRYDAKSNAAAAQQKQLVLSICATVLLFQM
jgi:hypothetical protein